MVPLADLWLPIVLSAVFVFVASSVIHMALQIHKKDFQKLPNEDQVLAAMRGAGLKPGFDLGNTDELGYAADKKIRCGHADIHATIQHLLGIDYKRNTFPYEGRDESLVGVTPARVLTELFA